MAYLNQRGLYKLCCFSTFPEGLLELFIEHSLCSINANAHKVCTHRPFDAAFLMDNMSVTGCWHRLCQHPGTDGANCLCSACLPIQYVYTGCLSDCLLTQTWACLVWHSNSEPIVFRQRSPSLVHMPLYCCSWACSPQHYSPISPALFRGNMSGCQSCLAFLSCVINKPAVGKVHRVRHRG